MNRKIIESAINGEITEFAELLKLELNQRLQKAIDERVDAVIDGAYNICEDCDEDDVWDDEDVEDLYHDENDPYEDEEEDIEGMNIGEGDDHDTRELHLYASNHADLHRQRMTPIHKNLRNKQAAGTYDSEKAHKAFGHAAKDAADRYHKEHGHRFSVATRKAVAAKMRDEFESDSKAGEHDHLLHKKHKGHKVESVEYTDEAIKYDAAHPESGITGKVTGKGKRDRGPGGKVMVQYKGHPAYGDKGGKLPIKARDIGRLLKTARKPGTTAYDSRNVRNPQITRDHVEHEVDEAVKPALRMGVDFKYKAPSEAEKTVMKQEKEKAAKMRATPDTSAAGRAAQRMIDARKKTEESVELEEGAPGQNPLVTAFGGMKAAQDTPSFKKYQARLKAEREARKREFERDQAAKKGTREEVEVDEAMGGKLKDVRKQAAKNQKKRKKGEKLAKKDHDGDGKIETPKQEYFGSRDRAIKAAIAARGGN